MSLLYFGIYVKKKKVLALCRNPWRAANCVFAWCLKKSWLNSKQVQMNSKHQNMNGIFSDLGRMRRIPSEFFERTFFEGDLTGRITHLPRSRSRCTPGSWASRHQTHRWKSVCTCGDFGKHPPKSHIPHLLPPRDLRIQKNKKHLAVFPLLKVPKFQGCELRSTGTCT